MKNLITLISLIFLFNNCDHPKYNNYTYFENGNIHSKCEMNGNLRNGKCVEYNKDGSIYAITNWKNDTLNGLASEYYKSGKLKASYTWLNGKLTGEFKMYYENGSLKESGFLEKGKKVGFVKYFKSGGQLSAIRNYLIKNDKSFLNEVIVFYPNGDTNYQKSNFFEIKIRKDTIKLGETFRAKLVLKAPYFKNSSIFVFFEVPHDTTFYRRIVAFPILGQY